MSLTSLPVQTTTVRRSANYQPSVWSYEYIQSLRNNHVGPSFSQRLEKLKEEVRMMLTDAVKDTLYQLELIDTLQRLGVSYHFENEIKSVLTIIHRNYKQIQDNLYVVALEFRLMRQYGFDKKMAEILSNFKDDKGNFKTCLNDDCKGILYLYEAAYLLEEGEESIFHDVKNFSTTYLKEYVKHNSKDEYLSTLVSHALEIPLHWRMQRLDARWFIDLYGRRKDRNLILLEFAKLDFNFVQATHQEDLKCVSRWWRKSLGDHDQLTFARDRLMEGFLWSLGSLFEPQFGYCRKMFAKLIAIMTIIDDVYDVYGTLDELELFTTAVERWDVSAMDQLPHYMRICFLALHNYINEIAFDALKEQGIHIIPYLKKEWADYCKSFLLEANWYHSGYIPTLEEFLDNAWISIGAPVCIFHVFCFTSITNQTEKEAFQCYKEYHNIIHHISLVIRLADDLGTSSDELQRGDVPKSIQCYMHETGASEEDARGYIRELITTTWMKINKGQCACNNAFIEFGKNNIRTALCLYQHGDGYGVADGETKDKVLSLLVNPIPITTNIT